MHFFYVRVLKKSNSEVHSQHETEDIITLFVGDHMENMLGPDEHPDR